MNNYYKLFLANSEKLTELALKQNKKINKNETKINSINNNSTITISNDLSLNSNTNEFMGIKDGSVSVNQSKIEHTANTVLRSIIKTNSEIANSQHIVYNFNKNNHRSTSIGHNHSIKLAIKFIKFFFASLSCLISKPLFISSPNKIIIRIFFYSGKDNLKNSSSKPLRNKRLKSLFRSKKTSVNLIDSKEEKLNILTNILSKIFKKNIELQLIKLDYPYHDSSILAEAIGSNSKRYKFRKILDMLWLKAVVKNPAIPAYRLNKKNTYKSLILKKDEKDSTSELFISNLKNLRQFLAPLNSTAMLMKNYLELKNKIKKDRNKNNKTKNLNVNNIIVSPVKLTGIKVRLSGRLRTERIVPRKTVQIGSIGSFAKGFVDNIDSANFTSKNKNGAFNIKVWLSHTSINNINKGNIVETSKNRNRNNTTKKNLKKLDMKWNNN
jgi:ribosomal protein S3